MWIKIKAMYLCIIFMQCSLPYPSRSSYTYFRYKFYEQSKVGQNHTEMMDSTEWFLSPSFSHNIHLPSTLYLVSFIYIWLSTHIQCRHLCGHSSSIISYLFFLSRITQAIIWSHQYYILGSVTSFVHSFFDPATISSTDPLIQCTLRNKSLYNSGKWHETKCSYQQYKG